MCITGGFGRINFSKSIQPIVLTQGGKIEKKGYKIDLNHGSLRMRVIYTLNMLFAPRRTTFPTVHKVRGNPDLWSAKMCITGGFGRFNFSKSIQPIGLTQGEKNWKNGYKIDLIQDSLRLSDLHAQQALRTKADDFPHRTQISKLKTQNNKKIRLFTIEMKWGCMAGFAE